MGMKMTRQVGQGEAPEPGTHEARVVAVIDLGTHPETYQGQAIGDRRKIYIAYEVTDEQQEDGSNKVIGRDYTFSGHEKSGLFKLCEAALGPTPEGGHDLEALLGQAVSLAIRVNDKGFADVEAVTALRPQQKAKVRRLDRQPYYWDLSSPAPVVDHDWLPWVYSRVQGQRVPVSQMIAASRERGGKAAPVASGGPRPNEAAV